MIEKTCNTCYHYYHNKHTVAVCRHALMCHEHDKWEPCTNGDYIRNCMNDEELVTFLCETSTCQGDCPVRYKCTCENNGYKAWINESTIVTERIEIPIDEEAFNER